MRLSRFLKCGFCLVLGFGPALNASAQDDRYAAKQADIDALTDKAKGFYGEGNQATTAGDVPGGCAKLGQSVNAYNHIDADYDDLIGLAADDPERLDAFHAAQAGTQATRDDLNARITRDCANTEANDNPINQSYDIVMAQYETLARESDDAFARANTAASAGGGQIVVCGHEADGLAAMKKGIGKIDEIIAIMTQADADPADNKKTRAGDQAIIDEKQKDYDDTCSTTASGTTN